MKGEWQLVRTVCSDLMLFSRGETDLIQNSISITCRDVEKRAVHTVAHVGADSS